MSPSANSPIPLDDPPLLSFEDLVHVEATSSAAPTDLVFGPIDFDDSMLYDDALGHHRDSSSDMDSENPSPHYFASSLSPQPAVASLDDMHFDSGGFYSPPEAKYSDSFSDPYMAEWTKDVHAHSIVSSTAPIPIPGVNDDSAPSRVYLPFPTYESPTYPQNASFSPAEFMTDHPLPDASSPFSFGNALSMGDNVMANLSLSHAGPFHQGDLSTLQSAWPSHLWDSASYAHSTSTIRPTRHSLLSDQHHHRRRRAVSQRGAGHLTQLFQSSSAPISAAPIASRSHSRRIESPVEDNDATIRRRKSPPSSSVTPRTPDTDGPGHKSVLRPPKLAPSAWQLYFTDWIQKHQASSSRKLNVAQAAKEAGQEYATLTAEEKEPYKRRSQAAKEQRERELAAYMKTLTPDDIKRENVFRAEQRKLGKSRKSNIKDPNAPKKPLSAYFMFLQWIRSDQALVQEIFGDESETTKQSVLAAARWRSMTDEQRKPFLAQAEQEKIEYESARRLYEDGTTGPSSSINFSILSGSMAERTQSAMAALKSDDVKGEPESDTDVSY